MGTTLNSDTHYLEQGIIVSEGAVTSLTCQSWPYFCMKSNASMKSITSNSIHSYSFSIVDKEYKIKGTNIGKKCDTQQSIKNVALIIMICGIMKHKDT
jgi:hypothetical protein